MKISVRSDMLVVAFQVKTVSWTELFTSKLSGFAHDQFKSKSSEPTRKKHIFFIFFFPKNARYAQSRIVKLDMGVI